MSMRNLNINKNHRLVFGDEYESMPLLGEHEPMVAEYLDALRGVIQCAVANYPRVAGFRFDLHLPQGMDAQAELRGNQVISRFIDSLKAKIAHNRAIAARTVSTFHDTRVRYFWVREVGDWGRVHYHFVLLLNACAFNWLGSYVAEGGNLASRIAQAWASALKLAAESAKTLVTFPDNPTYELRRDDPQSIRVFFQRASYMCKARTKEYGYGHHCYGASRG